MRKRLKGKPHPDVYALRVECLQEFENRAEAGAIALYYADESRVSLTPCVPYAWQFKDEQVFMPCAKGEGLNCFALLSRNNHCLAQTTRAAITGAFIAEQLDRFSLSLTGLTVVVLDNAAVHHGKEVTLRKGVWQERGLFIVYLPTYSPHLNIVEILWRKLKYEWLRAEDYAEPDTLFYAVWQALRAVGHSLTIRFSPFQNCIN